MSLYNLLFKENEEATALLGMIGCTREMFQRYRDVNLSTDGKTITVTTRLGGPNRLGYRQVFKNVMRNENYIKDWDDDFDNTYCYISFRVPEKYKSTCKTMAPKEEQPTVSELFRREIEESKIPGSPAAQRMDVIADKIINAIVEEDGNNDDNGGIHIIRL